VQCRIARFDHRTGELDLDHLASLVDSRTKLVCCTGASNFLGTKPSLAAVRAIADAGGYPQPTGERGARMLVDGAQLVPSSFVDVQALDVDYLTFSFHKFLAPFGVGVLYAKEHLLESSLPFLYGGDMIAPGMVFPDRVEYGAPPWKYSAGTPNILGVIVSGQALRLTADLMGAGDRPYFGTEDALPPALIGATMDRIGRHTATLTERAMVGLSGVPGLRILGVPADTPRSPLVAFTVAGRDPFDLADALNRWGVESRAGCHCATLAHHDLGLDPPASCRLSFYLYNSVEDVDRAVDAVRQAVAGTHPVPAQSREGRHRRLVPPGEAAARHCGERGRPAA
jgi:cysteine desulfurase/selenocysteine lyase